MDDAAAFRMGEIIGALMFFAVFIGSLVFFIIALVKAISTRRDGWIIAACLSSLPLLCLFLCMVLGFFMGLSRGFTRAQEPRPPSRARPAQFLTADMTPVFGNSVAYQISLPLLLLWAKDDSQPQFDHVFSYGNAYLGIIPEEVGLGTSQKICDFAEKNLRAKALDCSCTGAHPIEIDAHSWLTFDATATVNDIHVQYRYYVYSDTNYTFQIVGWTVPKFFRTDSLVFDRIAGSFKMPKDQ